MNSMTSGGIQVPPAGMHTKIEPFSAEVIFQIYLHSFKQTNKKKNTFAKYFVMNNQ